MGQNQPTPQGQGRHGPGTVVAILGGGAASGSESQAITCRECRLSLRERSNYISVLSVDPITFLTPCVSTSSIIGALQATLTS